MKLDDLELFQCGKKDIHQIAQAYKIPISLLSNCGSSKFMLDKQRRPNDK